MRPHLAPRMRGATLARMRASDHWQNKQFPVLPFCANG